MLPLRLLRNYLGAFDTPIVCAAPAYQGLDLNESLLIRFVGLELFAGCTTELFLVAFLDIVPPNANLPELLPCRQGGIHNTCRSERYNILDIYGLCTGCGCFCRDFQVNRRFEPLTIELLGIGKFDAGQE
jgi:hypothetical protein